MGKTKHENWEGCKFVMDSKKSEYEEETTNQTTKGKTIDKVRLRLSIDVNNAEIYFQRIN